MNEIPLVEDKAKPSILFSQMAERIEHNAAHEFGGAFVVVPPGDQSEPMTLLLLDAKQDPVQFWGLLKIKAEVALGALEELARTQHSAFGRR